MAPRDLDRATLTTAEAARSLQVSSATLKRWAAAGLIPSQRTRGGHRRFRAEDVRALVPPTGAGDDDASRAADLLLRVTGPLEVQSWLQAERRRRGSWWEVARVVRALSAELYRRRSSGALNGVQVEVALDQLRMAALRFAELAVVDAAAPVLLIASVPGDPYQVAAAFAQVCAPESGWAVRWAGHAEVSELEAELARQPAQALVVQRSVAAPASSLDPYAAQLEQLAARTHLPVAVVGMGGWPQETGAVAVLRSVVELREWLGACGARPGRRPRTAPPAATAEPGAGLAWSPELSTGNAVLDAHHRTIFEQVARFAEVVRGAEPAGGLRTLLDFVKDYTSVHFRVEEQLMRQSRYPEMNEHLWEHQCMARDLAAHERAVEESGRSRPALEQLAQFLLDWLRDHVSGSDQRLGAHLRPAAPAARPSPRR